MAVWHRVGPEKQFACEAEAATHTRRGEKWAGNRNRTVVTAADVFLPTV